MLAAGCCTRAQTRTTGRPHHHPPPAAFPFQVYRRGCCYCCCCPLSVSGVLRTPTLPYVSQLVGVGFISLVLAPWISSHRAVVNEEGWRRMGGKDEGAVCCIHNISLSMSLSSCMLACRQAATPEGKTRGKNMGKTARLFCNGESY